MKLVIKVGTQSILSHEGTPFIAAIKHLVQQIAELRHSNHQVVLVSSGAVSSGRKVAREHIRRQYGNTIGERQVLASLGQLELMRIYGDLFKKHAILSSQLLLTKQDFQTRKHYLNIARLLSEILNQPNIIPIVNENDSVAIEELMFTDNDELAGLIAAQMGADKLIILSNVAGVYTSHPDDERANLITEIDPEQGWPAVSTSKSLHGRGGMHSKLSTAKKVSSLGITTHIAGINEPSVIKRLVANERLGTTIHPYRKTSNIKRWIAYNSDKQNGIVYVNEALFKILHEKQRILSLLPVGLVKLSGQFKKGDLVEIRDLENNKIGVGIARYDESKLSGYLGQKDKPVFIHYDHLHIF